MLKQQNGKDIWIAYAVWRIKAFCQFGWKAAQWTVFSYNNNLHTANISREVLLTLTVNSVWQMRRGHAVDMQRAALRSFLWHLSCTHFFCLCTALVSQMQTSFGLHTYLSKESLQVTVVDKLFNICFGFTALSKYIIPYVFNTYIFISGL